MSLITVEGTYKDGRISLAETSAAIEQARVLVTFLPARGPIEPTREDTGQIPYGQFAGERRTNEEDFRSAEWHEVEEPLGR